LKSNKKKIQNFFIKLLCTFKLYFFYHILLLLLQQNTRNQTKIGYAMSMSPLGPMQVDVFFQELEKGMIFLYGFDVLVFNEE
jgi:hypothetical protein